MDDAYSPKNRKIWPSSPAKPTDLSLSPATEPTQKAKLELAKANIDLPDQEVMRKNRLNKVLSELTKRNLTAIVLFDPVNIRYALDARNMSIWTSRNFARAAFISQSGYIVLWDFDRCKHLSSHLSAIDEVRSDAGAYYFAHGDTEANSAKTFAVQVAELMKSHGGGKLAVDKLDLEVAQALQHLNLDLTTGQVIMEHARLIKGEEEIKAMRCSAHSCLASVKEMEEALCAGISEVELWSVLHAGNITRGGEWIETRLMASGTRTNPWMAEAGPRILENGDLLAFDTDMIGLYGYICDMSRTWLVGTQDPTDEQIELYTTAFTHITENAKLLKPGTSFRDLSFGGHQLAQHYRGQQYCVKMHGVGLCDEFPSIYYPEQFIEGAFDYTLKPGMVLCVEAYIGASGGKEGVKLENEMLITKDEAIVLTPYPFDDRLLGRT